MSPEYVIPDERRLRLATKRNRSSAIWLKAKREVEEEKAWTQQGKLAAEKRRQEQARLEPSIPGLRVTLPVKECAAKLQSAEAFFREQLALYERAAHASGWASDQDGHDELFAPTYLLKLRRQVDAGLAQAQVYFGIAEAKQQAMVSPVEAQGWQQTCNWLWAFADDLLLRGYKLRAAIHERQVAPPPERQPIVIQNTINVPEPRSVIRTVERGKDGLIQRIIEEPSELEEHEEKEDGKLPERYRPSGQGGMSAANPDPEGDAADQQGYRQPNSMQDPESQPGAQFTPDPEVQELYGMPKPEPYIDDQEEIQEMRDRYIPDHEEPLSDDERRELEEALHPYQDPRMPLAYGRGFKAFVSTYPWSE